MAVGINALIDRAAIEGTSIVIEGAHIVPGFLDLESHHDRILAVPFILGVDDEGRHLTHFATREGAVASRPARLARPEGVSPYRRASASIAVQILPWVSMTAPDARKYGSEFIPIIGIMAYFGG